MVDLIVYGLKLIRKKNRNWCVILYRVLVVVLCVRCVWWREEERKIQTNRQESGVWKRGRERGKAKKIVFMILPIDGPRSEMSDLVIFLTFGFLWVFEGGSLYESNFVCEIDMVSMVWLFLCLVFGWWREGNFKFWLSIYRFQFNFFTMFFVLKNEEPYYKCVGYGKCFVKPNWGVYKKEEEKKEEITISWLIYIIFIYNKLCHCHRTKTNLCFPDLHWRIKKTEKIKWILNLKRNHKKILQNN